MNVVSKIIHHSSKLMVILPAIHLTLVAVTLLVPGELIMVLGVDPLVFLFMFRADATVIFVFAGIGTLCWFLIGYLAWRANRDRLSKAAARISATCIFLVACFALLFLIPSAASLAEKAPGFLLIRLIQIVLTSLLTAGAFLSSLSCAKAGSTAPF